MRNCDFTIGAEHLEVCACANFEATVVERRVGERADPQPRMRENRVLTTFCGLLSSGIRSIVA